MGLFEWNFISLCRITESNDNSLSQIIFLSELCTIFEIFIIEITDIYHMKNAEHCVTILYRYQSEVFYTGIYDPTYVWPKLGVPIISFDFCGAADSVRLSAIGLMPSRRLSP